MQAKKYVFFSSTENRILSTKRGNARYSNKRNGNGLFSQVRRVNAGRSYVLVVEY